MEDLVSSIPEALAVIGSVGTIVFGVFAYLLKTRAAKANVADADTGQKQSRYLEDQVQGSHDRISILKDHVSDMDSDIRSMGIKMDNMQKAIEDHEERDIRDFDVLNKKIDKLTDIVIKILSDDKL